MKWCILCWLTILNYFSTLGEVTCLIILAFLIYLSQNAKTGTVLERNWFFLISLLTLMVRDAELLYEFLKVFVFFAQF